MPEFRMQIPATSCYKDVNTDMKMASFDREKANAYMERFGVEFDQVVTSLYGDKFLLYLRMFSSEKLCYVKSSCRAEMKKKIDYVVDITFTKHGFVHEAQCECGAGEGPFGHCKHIRTVLYACVKFVQSGEVKVESSCTQQLQSFHKSKKHTGSPVKARDLKIGGAEICNIADFDPRPSQFRNAANYKDHFYNTCMNFATISKTPIFQTFEPANMYAYSNDHDYFSTSHEQNFLNLNKITKITSEECECIEEQTRGQNTNDRWHEERGKRIQSSNYHRICAATEKTSLVGLASTIVQGQVVRQNEAMRHGCKYEKTAIHIYESARNVKVKSCGITVSRTHPFLGASPDGIVNKDLIVEVKCPFSAINKEISSVTVPYLKDVNGKLKLSAKHPYYYQIQGQLFCSERKYCDLIVYTLTDIKYIRVHKNEDFISQMLLKLEHFFENYFKTELLKKLYYKDV